jgi:uncharacterized protein (TIGR00106 family)
MLLEFSMYPLGKGESVGAQVARSLDIIDQSGLRYQLHAMGTVLEGEWDECFAVVKKCFDAMIQDCPRVEVVLKVDHRAGQTDRLQTKISSVEKRLGRRLNT